jgi:hypothetical protein
MCALNCPCCGKVLCKEEEEEEEERNVRAEAEE